MPGVFRFVSLRRATGRFLLLVLAALALQGIPFLFLGVEGDAGAALYLIHLYGVIPLAAVLLPLWAGLGGVHPLAAFFPIGLALLLLPVYESTGVALVCMLLSLIAAVAGQEWKKRRETKKGNHHGGKAKKGRIGKFFGAVGSVALVLILVAVIYLAAVLLASPGTDRESSWIVEEDPVPVTRMQSASTQDARELARLFGAPLPVLPGFTPAGEAGNATHDGEPARVATLRYEGLTITAVRPASAAPLLLRGEMDVQLRSDLTVLSLPAVLADRGRAHCLYFSDETAAYSLYAPQAEEEEFLSLLSRLSWVQ